MPFVAHRVPLWQVDCVIFSKAGPSIGTALAVARPTTGPSLLRRSFCPALMRPVYKPGKGRLSTRIILCLG
jgi:hypothetical protein